MLLFIAQSCIVPCLTPPSDSPGSTAVTTAFSGYHSLQGCHVEGYCQSVHFGDDPCCNSSSRRRALGRLKTRTRGFVLIIPCVRASWVTRCTSKIALRSVSAVHCSFVSCCFDAVRLCSLFQFCQGPFSVDPKAVPVSVVRFDV